ncbi:MAG: phospholipid carrier-dependent glycosyltransferase [Deltaproteobacteria bacterium]|nr:phospholipid carrier-dependent glycosyltransferase [Deltaproteobacteria bacterium]
MRGRDKEKCIAGLVFFVIIVMTVRFLIASKLGLAPDEAYYWQWSRNLALTYPDHPPLIAWLVRLGTTIAGDNEIGVRLACVTMSGIAVVITYSIGRAATLERRHAFMAAILATTLPVPATGSLIATPDTPLGLCYLLALFALIRLSKLASTNKLIWYLLGATFGVALLSKHAAFLIPVATIALIIRYPHIRHDLRTVHPWLAMFLSLLIALPHFIAEARAGFPAVSFQIAHLLGALGHDGDIGPGLLRIVELISGQIGLLTPIVAGWIVYAIFKSRNEPTLFVLAAGFLIPLAFSIMSALFTHPEQNWASLGHPAAAILVVWVLTKRRVWLTAVFITTISVTCIIHAHAIRPFLPLPAKQDPISRLHGWSRLSTLTKHMDKIDAIVCDNYGLAAETSWHLRHISKRIPIVGMNRPACAPQGNWLLLDEQAEWGDAKLEVNCAKTHLLGDLELKRKDETVLRTVKTSLGNDCQ